MKKITMMLLLLCVAATGFAQKKKVAVVTFYADKQVDLSGVGLTGLDMVADLANDPTFNLQPMLENFHNAFFTDYAKQFPFDLLPEATVTGNAEYKAYVPEFPSTAGAGSYTAIEGYKAINHNWGKNNEKAMLKMFPGADGVMFVFINFSLEKGFGIGGTATTKMRAYTNIVLYNKKGEKVFTINENANSKKTGVMAGGVPIMKADKVLPMCQSALDELMKDLNKRIQKIVDKSGKKL